MMHAHGALLLKRIFPSANMALIPGTTSILVDTGFGTDAQETEQMLMDYGVPIADVGLIVNTHYHSDHAGGNHWLQSRYGIPIAAHRWEAVAVNRRDAQVCSAEWLDQPVQPYRVDRPLSDGDCLSAGIGPEVLVVHTPGHTLGHIALFLPHSRLLLCGDAFHADDVAWINQFREGAGALYRAMESLDRLAALRPLHSFSGHGEPCSDPLAAIDAARRRYEKWAADPDKLGWHACKRIFAYALMLVGGLPEESVAAYLLRCPWYQDFSRYVFRTDPADFVPALVEEMVRSGAAGWDRGRLSARAPHRFPGNPLDGPVRPQDWPE